jgi:hypothetical protein
LPLKNWDLIPLCTIPSRLIAFIYQSRPCLVCSIKLICFLWCSRKISYSVSHWYFQLSLLLNGSTRWQWSIVKCYIQVGSDLVSKQYTRLKILASLLCGIINDEEKKANNNNGAFNVLTSLMNNEERKRATFCHKRLEAAVLRTKRLETQNSCFKFIRTWRQWPIHQMSLVSAVT